MEKVKVIPTIPSIPKRRKVVAYARVSNAKDAMLNSLSQQISYYSDLIQNNPEWLYSGVYADEGISGTKNDRPEFQRMINDCKDGKVDLIITKSISRFARNTVTLLETIRMLKEINVEVYFEEQNIYTLSSDGEFMLTLLASYAQEEAKSVSDNMKWRIKKNFEEGIPWGARLYGYDVIDSKYYINEEEAKVVKLIYELYLSGLGKEGIARKLNSLGYKTRIGGKWTESSIRIILHNYDYTGNLLLQKTFRNDFISKKTMMNNGERDKFHVEDNHEAIIPLELWQTVQEERNRRNNLINKNIGVEVSLFKGLIKCDNCGKSYLRKISKYRNYWLCATYLKNGSVKCSGRRLDEEELYRIINELSNEYSLSLNDFISYIKEIRVKDLELVVILVNGDKQIRTFVIHSRKDSWSNEMKENARKREIERRQNNG